MEITDEYIEKTLREGKEVIFQEEREKRSLQMFTELFKELQSRELPPKETK